MPTPSDVLSLQALNRALLDRQLLLRRAPRNGIFPGTVLINGFVRGMWRIVRSRGVATATIELFGSVGERDREAVKDEGQRLLEFAAPDADHDIRFAPIT